VAQAFDRRLRQARAAVSVLSTLALLEPGVLESDGWGDWRRDRDRQLAELAERSSCRSWSAGRTGR
jgi:hypothetical protein